MSKWFAASDSDSSSSSSDSEDERGPTTIQQSHFMVRKVKIDFNYDFFELFH